MLVDGFVTHRSPFVRVSENSGGGSLSAGCDTTTSSAGRPILMAERRPASMTNGGEGALRPVPLEPTALTVATYVPGLSFSSVSEISAVHSPVTIGGFPRFWVADGAPTSGLTPLAKISRT